MCGECYTGANNLEVLLDAVNYNRFQVDGFVGTQGHGGRLHNFGDHRFSGGQPTSSFDGLVSNPIIRKGRSYPHFAVDYLPGTSLSSRSMCKWANQHHHHHNLDPMGISREAEV